MIDTIATVDRNLELAPGFKLLTLNFSQSLKVHAGQFAMLKAHNSLEPLLRRALAIYRRESAQQLSFLYQILGRGTQALAMLVEGSQVDVLLPLGNRWLADTEANENGRQALVVAGGIGSASVL